jgi:soluble lytic murein transglycosylase-like protein
MIARSPRAMPYLSFRPLHFPLALACAALVMLAAAWPAAADVWGYVDENGRAHVASERLDERYQLFFRGRSSADVVPPSVAAVDEAFERSAIFRRVENHPNVKRFEPLLARYAKQHGVDFALVKAVVAVESAYEPDAVSAKGAIGLMQVIPATAERYGVTSDAKRTVEEKLRDPAVNVSVGTRYLRDLLLMFPGNLVLALAAYNAGEAAVQRFDNTVPPFPETREFVTLVDQFYALYKPPPLSPRNPLRITVPKRTPPAREPPPAPRNEAPL